MRSDLVGTLLVAGEKFHAWRDGQLLEYVDTSIEATLADIAEELISNAKKQRFCRTMTPRNARKETTK